MPIRTLCLLLLWSLQTFALTAQFTDADLDLQETLYPSHVRSEAALQLAVQTLLRDAHTSKSPLAIAGSHEALLNVLGFESSVLYLVTANDIDHKPEWGEKVQESWIFCLYMPTLSDHLYWIVVDRGGKLAPYVYGFN